MDCIIDMTNATKKEFKSTQGQQARVLQLHYEELTKNERDVVRYLATEGRPVRTIKEIMEGLNWNHVKGGRARGNSRVRNSLRRLVQSGWVGHETAVGDGRYRLTRNAADRLRRMYTISNDNVINVNFK
jgi:predicted DNA-binding transcriptional regulator